MEGNLMGSTPNFLIPYPDLEVVADVPSDMRVMAERIEAVLAQIQAKATADAIARIPRIAQGTAVLPFTADPYISVAVKYPAGLFTAAPRVVLTAATSYVIATFSANSTAGFTAWGRHMNDTKFTANVSAYWIAVQNV